MLYIPGKNDRHTHTMVTKEVSINIVKNLFVETEMIHFVKCEADFDWRRAMYEGITFGLMISCATHDMTINTTENKKKHFFNSTKRVSPYLSNFIMITSLEDINGLLSRSGHVNGII